MVAQRHAVGAGVTDAPGLLRRQSHTGDIFSVDNNELNMFQLLQGAQMLFQMPQAVFAHHIAHRQHMIQHGVSSIL